MSKKKIALGTLLVLVSVAGTYGQKPTPQPAPPDPCSATRAIAHLNSFNDGFRTARADYSTTLTEKPGELKIQILTETATESFRLAAAEVIRSQFAGSLVIVPEAELILYVNGLDPNRYGFQDIGVRVEAMVKHSFIAGNEQKTLWGALILAEKEVALRGYTPEQRTQAVREQTYAVISDFLRKWERAKPQANP